MGKGSKKNKAQKNWDRRKEYHFPIVGRPRHEVPREPNGRSSRRAEYTFDTERDPLKNGREARQRDCEVLGVSTGLWDDRRHATSLGKLSMQGIISDAQFRAGEKLAGYIARWRTLKGLPKGRPTNLHLPFTAKGHGTDHLSEDAYDELIWLEKTLKNAYSFLTEDWQVHNTVMAVVDWDSYPIGDQVGTLRIGLNILTRIFKTDLDSIFSGAKLSEIHDGIIRS